MLRKAKFEKLLEPFEIRGVKLRNRMVRSPCALGLSDIEGFVSQADKSYFEAVARGGVGLLIAGASYVDVPLGITELHRFWVSDDKFIPGLSELVQVIHKHGCPTFLELQHSGPSFPSHLFDGLRPVAASSLTKGELPPRPAAPFHPPRALSLSEIEDLVIKFAIAAERARKAGFDGVVIEACHSYLINSFLSRGWNKRQDAYGCQTIESRGRFAVEIIQAIKARLGREFPVGIRINGGEWGLKNGITAEESQEISILLEEAGADFLDVSGIGYEPDYGFFLFPEQLLYPEPVDSARLLARKIRRPGLEVTRAEAIKKAVSIPVIAVGRLDPKLGEWILKRDKADLIAFGRRLIADPELPNKVASGRLEDIVPCMGCLECIFGSSPGGTMRCRVNPSLAREHEYEIKLAERKRKIMVIGAGPAGLEAARVAALRGHEVVLCEKEHRFGGLLPLAALVKGLEIEDLPALVQYYRTQLRNLNVQVMLDREANIALVDEIKPDVVILATGGVFDTPEIPGIKSDIAMNASDLHRKANPYLRFLGPKVLRWLTKFYFPVGRRVVVMGGLIHGCETAEFLVKRGRKVTIVEASDELGIGIPYARRLRLLNWLDRKGVTMLSEARSEKISNTGLTVITKEGSRKTIEADTVLIAVPPKANSALLKTLEGAVPEIYPIGDCKEPRLILDAIADGSLVGQRV